MELKIEYIDIEDLKPYLNNAKIHTAEQIKQIKKSIEEFGMNDPIAVWHENEIIEGHGRLIALKELGYNTVPIVRLDHLTDEQRRAYMLVHNKLTMNTDFDADLLSIELEDLTNINMEDFGFGIVPVDEVDEDEESNYSQKAKIPQYDPTGEAYEINELYDDTKTRQLVDEIMQSDIPEDVKKFLIISAYRHTVFYYRKIAEYYANADEKIQNLMEKSALVIIDIDDAIANGYVKMSKTIEDLMNESEQ